MENWLIAEIDILIKVGISILLIFSITIILTRIFGLRTFAKMSSFDFASTIAIGSILANVVMNTNQSILKAGIALTLIIAFQILFSVFTKKSNIFQKLFTNKPQLLMWQGNVLYENLKRTNVGLDDLMAKLREANVHSLSEVSAVILESTGDISVLHTTDEKKIEDIILTNVDKSILEEKNGKN